MGLSAIEDRRFFPAAVSLGAHLLMWCGARLFLVLPEPPAMIAELDLSMAPVAAAAVKRSIPARKPAAAAIPEANDAPTSQLTAAQEPEEEPATDAGETAGAETGKGAYIQASAAARGPRWIANHLTSRDYPLVAREQGKDGLVVLRLRIDAEGKVREVLLLSGSYAPLNAVALEKAKAAVFSPACDSAGRPVPCEVRLPIRFKLKN